MREKEIVIRLHLPQSPRARWLLGGVLAAVCLSTIVYAAVPNVFNAGDPLSATKVNANFSNLDGRVTAITPPTTWSWITPTFMNTYGSYGSTWLVGYYKDTEGIVHLRGLLTPTAAQNMTAAFNLPAGYRPGTNRRFSVYGCNSTDVIGNAATGNIGDVIPQCPIAANAITSLDGISFHAEQ